MLRNPKYFKRVFFYINNNLPLGMQQMYPITYYLSPMIHFKQKKTRVLKSVQCTFTFNRIPDNISIDWAFQPFYEGGGLRYIYWINIYKS